MWRYFINPIRGVLLALILSAVTVFWASAIVISAALVSFVPTKRGHHFATKLLLRLPVYWLDSLKLGLQISTFRKWDIQGPQDLDPNKSYLLMCNHQDWFDILVLGYVFNRKTAIIKFFMKKQLLWTLPFAAWACWALGFPFMERHTAQQIRKKPELKGKDIETTKKACKKFISHHATVMNFVEGTRFSDLKKEGQKSPYHHLLKPKSGGLAIVLHETKGHLAGIINATIVYEKSFTLWQCLRGDFKKIVCHYELLPIEEELIGDYYTDRQFRKQIQQWLNRRWQEKDAQIDSLAEK
jgi:1-acyl-sn-glycerol-3-phosphate acyltransferase